MVIINPRQYFGAHGCHPHQHERANIDRSRRERGVHVLAAISAPRGDYTRDDVIL